MNTKEGEINKLKNKKNRKHKKHIRSRSRSRDRYKDKYRSRDKHYDRNKNNHKDKYSDKDKYADKDKCYDRKKQKKYSKSRSKSKSKNKIKAQIKEHDRQIENNINIIPILEETKETKETIDYNKIREERQKRLEEIKKKSEQNISQPELIQEPTQIHSQIFQMSNEDKIKLYKMVENEREKNLQQDLLSQNKNETKSHILQNSALNDCGDKSPKTPDMFSSTPIDNLIPEDQKILKMPELEEDETGYYAPKMNELINNRYKVTGICGKGIFSNVVRVVDININKEYAIKIIRAIDVMIISGEKEKSILRKLNEVDKNDRSNIVRLIDTFELKRHLCLVFDLYEMNLRDLLKLKGTGVGIPLTQIRNYAQQLLFAFDLVHKYKIIHADFKPDNTIVSKNLDKVRLCDFGSALQVDEAVITSELVSRFYRPPEIFLGCPYDTKIDIWSLGCTLFELYTGKILFPGRNNNEMIKLIMMTKGKISQKVLKRGQFSNIYFNENGDFLSLEIDPYNKTEYIKEINVSNYPVIGKDLMSLLKSSNSNKLSTSEENKLMIFKEFLEKCLHLDAHKRFSTLEALTHEFIGIMPKSK